MEAMGGDCGCERAQADDGEGCADAGMFAAAIEAGAQADRRGGTGRVQHGNAGRTPSNKLASGVREEIEQMGRERYDGFNDHHFRDKLETAEKIVVSVSMVRRLRRAAGIKATRRRQPPVHRRRRDRKAQAGLMVLWDGSHHDWLQGRGPSLSLIGAIDDATSELLPGAHFVEQ